MRVPSQPQAIRQISERLAGLVDPDCRALHLKERLQVDAVLRAGRFVFVVEWKSVGSAASTYSIISHVRQHAEEFQRAGEADGEIVPLVAVPFMGKFGREHCAEYNVSWLDLSGNARISAPGLRILVEGKPNQYKRPGRPSTPFAPRSSRIARWLLMHPTRPLTQRELARATGTDEGYTSRVVGKLEDEGLILRNDTGAIRPRDPDLLLDAWLEAYDFNKHYVLRGHVAARSGDALLPQLCAGLIQASVSHAATGLAAAWTLGHFAGFRTTSVYLRQEPSSDLLAALSFREDDRGANVWLIVPNDEGVFHGAATRNGIHCVHPVQAYLDLHAHPERAGDVARELRSEHLHWRTGD